MARNKADRAYGKDVNRHTIREIQEVLYVLLKNVTTKIVNCNSMLCCTIYTENLDCSEV